MLRLPSPFSVPAISLGPDTSRILPFLRVWQGGNMYPVDLDCWGSVNPKKKTESRSEAVGSPVFPYYPCLPLISSQTPAEVPRLVYDAGSLLS
jgi:hypothetical protein